MKKNHFFVFVGSVLTSASVFAAESSEFLRAIVIDPASKGNIDLTQTVQSLDYINMPYTINTMSQSGIGPIGIFLSVCYVTLVLLVAFWGICKGVSQTAFFEKRREAKRYMEWNRKKIPEADYNTSKMYTQVDE